MIKLLFTPVSIGPSAIVILFLAAFGYLLIVRGKSRATQWFTVLFGGFTLVFLNWFSATALYTSSEWVLQAMYAVNDSGITLIFWAYLHFAYWFLGNPFRREAKIALWVTSALLVALLGYGAYTIVVHHTSAQSNIPGPLLVYGYTLWATVVLVRKWRRTTRLATSEPERRAARAFRAYALLTGVPLIISTLIVLFVTGVLAQAGIAQQLNALAQLIFFFGVVVVYLNHAPEPVSIQVKLIGLALVTTMALMVAVGTVRPEVAPVEAPEHEAIRFEPNAPGGYEVVERPVGQVSGTGLGPALGDDLRLPDDSSRVVALGFPFPFAGTTWDSLYVSPNGAVSFGAPIYRGHPIRYDANYVLSDLPKIAPFSIDLDPSAGGGVYVRRDSARATVTWHDVPQFQTDRRSTFQLVLHASGAIDVRYDRLDVDLTYREMPVAGRGRAMRGLVPGRSPVDPGRVTTPTSAAALPVSIASGTAYVEDYELAYRERAHEETQPLVGLTLGAALFVLVVFPFFFRSSLVKPVERLLGGVRRVNDGDLETEVPVGVRDEVGRLAYHFNRMTESLRRYRDEMEALVAERTREVERSLDELRTTQQQLIHAEKMASLGQLTAGIAHEIKNPLNFVNNFSGLSEELVDELHEALTTGDTDEVEAILADLKLNASKIREHGQRADGIVRSMMQHAHGGEGQRETVDLNALVEEYVDLAYHGKRAQTPDFNTEIKKDLDEDVGMVEVVPQEIGRVLLNLVGNAFDAVYEQQKALDESYAPTVTVSTRQTDGEVEIRIADNGPGIPEDVREKIFEPFFTTKPTGSGTGLGLSLSYDIVTQGHGGTLTAQSEDGQGAAFVVTLPTTPVPAS